MIIGTLKQINEKLKDKNPETKYKIVQYRETRSLNQNKYLHSIFSMIGDETGYTMEEVKEMLKFKFLMKETELGNYVKLTRDLDSKEMTEFIENIRNWSSDKIGLYVPSPDDRNIFEFYKQYGY